MFSLVSLLMPSDRSENNAGGGSGVDRAKGQAESRVLHEPAKERHDIE
jgi:hypothetical protein